MDPFAATVMVVGLAALELWAAIPVGILAGLHPLAVAIAAAFGALLGGTIVLLLGERVRNWLAERHGAKERKGRPGRLREIWHRYGVVGLGLLAPLITGVPLGVAVGLAFGAPARPLFVWTALGTILWSAILTSLTVVGVLGIGLV